MSIPTRPSRFILTVRGFAHDLQVLAFSGREAISEPFSFDIELVSDDPALDLDALLDQPAFLQFGNDERNGSGINPQGIHGQVSSVMQGATGVRLTRYAITLSPYLARLAHRHNQRIFQNLSVPQIITAILKEHHILENLHAFTCTHTYPEREYCVQYAESDLHFVQRLCEEEGIHYHFRHSPEAHTLVFGDAPNVFPKRPPINYRQARGMVPAEPTVQRFELRHTVRTQHTACRDFDFLKAHRIQAADTHLGAPARLEDYFYPGHFSGDEQGRHRAQRALERHRADARLAEGQSDQPGLASGHFLDLQQHPNAEWNQLWLLTEVIHEGRQPQVLEEAAVHEALRESARTSTAIDQAVIDGTTRTDTWQGYRNRFQATPWDVPYRPPLAHPRTALLGVHSARVTGPKGEEIHCDEHGRVKVQFHWDREGQLNERSSCWLRIAQAWAGSGYGAQVIPRIGSEVLVTFIDGDPDRPVISGCLYNSQHPLPHELPRHKTRSVFKSRSSPGGGGFNELRIEDRQGQEEIFVHAQRDWVEQIGHDQNIQVGHQRRESIQHNSYSEFHAEQHCRVHGERKTEVRGSDHLTVGDKQHLSIGTALLVDSGGEIHLASGSKVVIEGDSELVLKAGGHFIKINSDGVFSSLLPLPAANAGVGSGAAPLLPGTVAQLPGPAGPDIPAQFDAFRIEQARCLACEQAAQEKS